ncbi:MAG: helix-turn-helix domain-containing protein [Thermoguttaceae bacterium]|nr:helix-turn-helix domain-containing protein [Thermoguttaceae bacterium]
MICGLQAVGEILGLSPDRIKRLMDEERLEYVRIGRRYYFRRECLAKVGRSAVEKKQGKNQPK